ncbi:MAG: helix-turn-helix domain-containing protein [Burkholderiales bacterium]
MQILEPINTLTLTKELGHRIRMARTRRQLTIAELAEKAGINRNTLGALEKGKPGVAMSAYITCLWVMGLEGTLNAVANPDADSHGKTLESARLPKRVRHSRSNANEYDF